MNNIRVTPCGVGVEAAAYESHVRSCLTGPCRLSRNTRQFAVLLEDLRVAVKRGTHLATHRAAVALLEAYDG